MDHFTTRPQRSRPRRDLNRRRARARTLLGGLPLLLIVLLLTACPPPPTSASFNLSLNPTSLTMAQGSSDTVTVDVTATGSFSGDVDLALNGATGGITGSFDPNTITLANASLGVQATSTLTITVPGSTPIQSYTLEVEATSGSISKTQTLSVTVEAPPGTIDTVEIANNGNSDQVRQGAGPITVNITGSNLMGLTIVQLGGISGTVTSNTNNAATLAFTIPANATIGSASLDVTASAGSFSKADAVEITAITSTPSGNDTSGRGTPDSPFRSVTQAISVASAGDTVQLANGTYNTANGETFPLTVAGLTINGGVAGLSLQQAGSTSIVGDTVSSCLVVSGTSSLSNLSVSSCNFAVSILNGANATVTGVTATSSNTGLGANSASVAITNSSFNANNGPGIFLFGSSAATGSSVTTNNNTGINGYGLRVFNSSTANFTTLTSTGNDGNGVRIEGSAQATISGGTVSNNGTTSDDGTFGDNVGILIQNSAVATLSGLIIDSNGLGNGTGGTEADGVRVLDTASLTIGGASASDTTISNSGLDGLGQCCTGTTVNATNVDINSSAEDGINIFGGTASITGGTIDSNGSGGVNIDLDGTDTATVTLSGVTVSNSLANGIFLDTDGASAVGNLTVTDSTISSNGTSAIKQYGDNSGTTTVQISGGTFSNNGTNAIDVWDRGNGTANHSLTISGTTIQNSSARGIWFTTVNGSLEISNAMILNNGSSGTLAGIQVDSASPTIDLGTSGTPGNNVISGSTGPEFLDDRPARGAADGPLITLVGTQLGSDSANTCTASTQTGPFTKTDPTDGDLLVITNTNNRVSCGLP